MNNNRVEVRDASQITLFNWGEIWYYRELFYFFTWRDIKIKYKQTFLGFLWAVLQPLLMMLIFTIFFGRALRVPSQNIEYPVFVFSGLLMWNIFSSGLANASNSMVNNALIIKKIYFPRLVIPVSSMLVAVFDFLMAFLLLIPLLFYYQQPVSPAAIWAWPLAIFIGLVGTFGPGCLLAALNVKYRDFRYVIPFLIQILFFITPVIYPVSLLQDSILQYLIVASPMYAAVEIFRFPLTGIEPNMTFILISITSAFLFLILGLAYFRRTEIFFADIV
jgi:lipopolysaccharide transport system permease protein